MKIDLSLKLDSQEEAKTDEQPPQLQKNRAGNEFLLENKLKEKSQEIIVGDDQKSIEYYSSVDSKRDKMKMNQMKEENKILRSSVEQTMKDYYDLQIKVNMIQKNNQKKDPKIFFSLNGNDEPSDQETNRIPKIFDIKNQTLLSPLRREDDVSDNTELGLSLTLKSSEKKVEAEDEQREKKEDREGLTTWIQGKLHGSSTLPGITSHVTSPSRRKSRVSVRARCETATVSFALSLYMYVEPNRSAQLSS
ncbi:probable WRKY transcription factor 9 [Olea europaea var. sylvestris]|uniref:probable WRKY transcription factor 9 n=1 Tax=Olea europaea var. sylvestris TaxID=158386 RepID=UPI000C1D85D8|nr:probable WRKY transcription factor 9 [Olea europaea var. sylvestris]